jgi:hypothetical protein
MSNIDNMGATVDLNILNLCLSENHEFIMEVTDKTRDEYLSQFEIFLFKPFLIIPMTFVNMH